MKNLFTRFVRWVGRGVRPVLLGIGAIFGFANVVVDAAPAATVAAPAAANTMSAPAATVAAPAAANTMSAPAATVAAPAAANIMSAPAATVTAPTAAKIMSAPTPTVAAPAAQQIKSTPAATVTAPAAAMQSEAPAFAGEKASANEPEAAQQESPLRELSYAGREISRFGAKLLHESGVHVFVGVIVHNLGWSFAWNFAFVALGLLIGAMLLRSAAQFFASLLEGGPAPAV